MKTKKTAKVKLVFLAIVIIATATSCKNGTIFGKSNKENITKKWVLNNGSVKYTSYYQDTLSYDFTYTADSMKLSYGLVSYTVAYSETLTFNEDGTFKMNIIQGTDEGDMHIENDGTWEFLLAEGKYDDDERVKLIPKYSKTTQNGTTTIDTLENDNNTYTNIMTITKLNGSDFKSDISFITETSNSKIENIGTKNYIEN